MARLRPPSTHDGPDVDAVTSAPLRESEAGADAAGAFREAIRQRM
ncbi:hypothetical protein [Halorubrum sp. N11]